MGLSDSFWDRSVTAAELMACEAAIDEGLFDHLDTRDEKIIAYFKRIDAINDASSESTPYSGDDDDYVTHGVCPCRRVPVEAAPVGKLDSAEVVEEEPAPEEDKQSSEDRDDRGAACLWDQGCWELRESKGLPVLHWLCVAGARYCAVSGCWVACCCSPQPRRLVQVPLVRGHRRLLPRVWGLQGHWGRKVLDAGRYVSFRAWHAEGWARLHGSLWSPWRWPAPNVLLPGALFWRWGFHRLTQNERVVQWVVARWLAVGCDRHSGLASIGETLALRSHHTWCHCV